MSRLDHKVSEENRKALQREEHKVRVEEWLSANPEIGFLNKNKDQYYIYVDDVVNGTRQFIVVKELESIRKYYHI